MKRLRKLICFFLGHRSICLHKHVYNHIHDNPNSPTSSYTGWKCERCETTFEEGWDE